MRELTLLEAAAADPNGVYVLYFLPERYWQPTPSGQPKERFARCGECTIRTIQFDPAEVFHVFELERADITNGVVSCMVCGRQVHPLAGDTPCAK